MTYSDETYNLRIELDTKHCDLSAEEIARMERALAPLDRVTRKFPVSDLYVTVIHHPRSGDFHVKTALVLSGRTLFTGERSRDLYAAYEQCIDQLVRKVNTYKHHLSADDEHSKQAKGTLQGVVATQVPDHEAIQQAVAADDYVAFRRATTMFEEPVRKRVGRWIQRYPELQRQIGRELKIADFVEDVFLTAFEFYESKPAEVPVGDWLQSLIEEVVKDIADHPERELDNISMVQSAQEAEEDQQSR